ncbi:MAG: hypothetical protein VX061_03390 [Pseudomonadota bacterium]|nr:hypothetical protein [Pseudomonadota bacterium]
MLEFINESDFLKVERFAELEDGSVSWAYSDEAGTYSGVIRREFERKIEGKGRVDVWQALLDMEKAKLIKVEWLTEAEKQSIKERDEEIERASISRVKKLQGVLINGEQISLTEENQNGMAAVMQGVNLAAEMGADIFPLNFNAQTPAGFKLMTFEAVADFKTFCLTFMAERQKFFK